jgi:hypothetical protein
MSFDLYLCAYAGKFSVAGTRHINRQQMNMVRQNSIAVKESARIYAVYCLDRLFDGSASRLAVPRNDGLEPKAQWQVGKCVVVPDGLI